MTIEQFRNVCNAKPFQPFTIHTADGDRIPVLHREFVWSTPGGRTIVVGHPDDSMNIIDLLLVTRLETTPPPRDNGERRGRRRGQDPR